MSRILEKNGSKPRNRPASIFVGGLHPNVTENALFEHFSTCGQILSIRVCRDDMTMLNLGHAYINFVEQSSAERAVMTMNKLAILGRPITVMWPERAYAMRGRHSKYFNVLVITLHSKNMEHEDLFQSLSVFGSVLTCKISFSKKERKRYGLVLFETMDAAERATTFGGQGFYLRSGRKVILRPYCDNIDSRIRTVDRTERKRRSKARNKINKPRFGTEFNFCSTRDSMPQFSDIGRNRCIGNTVNQGASFSGFFGEYIPLDSTFQNRYTDNTVNQGASVSKYFGEHIPLNSTIENRYITNTVKQGASVSRYFEEYIPLNSKTQNRYFDVNSTNQNRYATNTVNQGASASRYVEEYIPLKSKNQSRYSSSTVNQGPSVSRYVDEYNPLDSTIQNGCTNFVYQGSVTPKNKDVTTISDCDSDEDDGEGSSTSDSIISIEIGAVDIIVLDSTDNSDCENADTTITFENRDIVCDDKSDTCLVIDVCDSMEHQDEDLIIIDDLDDLDIENEASTVIEDDDITAKITDDITVEIDRDDTGADKSKFNAIIGDGDLVGEIIANSKNDFVETVGMKSSKNIGITNKLESKSIMSKNIMSNQQPAKRISEESQSMSKCSTASANLQPKIAFKRCSVRISRMTQKTSVGLPSQDAVNNKSILLPSQSNENNESLPILGPGPSTASNEPKSPSPDVVVERGKHAFMNSRVQKIREKLSGLAPSKKEKSTKQTRKQLVERVLRSYTNPCKQFIYSLRKPLNRH